MTKITADGMLIAAGVLNARRPPIEKGPMKHVRGIIVHQSDSSTAQATLNSYLRAGNGAHFLIDKDGTIYQTASLLKKTWHVGKLKAKCFETHTCSAAEVKIGPTKHTAIYRIEMRKSIPNRFPSNEDSIGIELVGRCILDPKLIKEGMSSEEIERLRSSRGVYETVTPAQNIALTGLISELQTALTIPRDQVYRHPRVSAKNPSEASTAQWAGAQ